MRTLIPADSLVYLESNDLGAVMNAITERPAFREAAKTIPDFSVLNGVKLAVAVTGFETKEEKITDENSVLNFQPRFVAILETNAWNYQALAFTEQKLGEFINNVYGGEVLLETSDKHDGKFLVWTAKDGRKAFALVQGSLVFFGNDETAIEKSLTVKRGEAESITKNPKISNGDRLAFGYVSTDGVVQIANFLGVKFGHDVADDSVLQSVFATILPALIRNSVTELTWTATKSDLGVEDRYLVTMPSDLANIFNETMAPSDSVDNTLIDFVPADATSVTQYNLKNPQVAWRGMLLSAQKLLAAQNHSEYVSRKALLILSSIAFQPYAIHSVEGFLSAVGPGVVTVRDKDGEGVLVISRVVNKERLGEAFHDDVAHVDPLIVDMGSQQAVVLYGDRDRLGVADQARQSESKLKADKRFADRSNGIPAARTLASSSDSAVQIATLLSEGKPTDSVAEESISYTETRFNKNGFERRIVSDFGFIGWIITQFGKEE